MLMQEHKNKQSQILPLRTSPLLQWHRGDVTGSACGCVFSDSGYRLGRRDTVLIGQEAALAIRKLAEVHPHKDILWR